MSVNDTGAECRECGDYNVSYICLSCHENIIAGVNHAIYKTGYQDGFDDGLKAGRQCRKCEYIGKCQDDPQKTDYCPNSKLRGIR